MKTLTSVVERLTETVNKTVDMLKMEMKETATGRFLAFDRSISESEQNMRTMQKRIKLVETTMNGFVRKHKTIYRCLYAPRSGFFYFHFKLIDRLLHGLCKALHD